jgi:predicted GIY-YIG superfamily endonuclease
MKHAIDPLAPLLPQLQAIGLDGHLGHKTTALYRFFAADDSLLYIGITKNPLSRWQSHRRKAAWWSAVVAVAVEWHLYTNAAIDAEYAAIKAERPLFNVQGVPSDLSRSSELSHTLLMRNVPLSLSRSRSRSLRGRDVVPIHLQTVRARFGEWMAADAAIGGVR